MEIRDKRRSPSIAKLVPYLGGIFSHVLRVPVGPTVTVMKDGKKRKLDYGSPTALKQKTENRISWVTLECSVSVPQVGASKFSLFPLLPKVSQAGAKAKTITFLPPKVGEKVVDQR